MPMTPLKQWICDTCGELIEKPEQGWLEWKYKHGTPGTVSEFRICHQLLSSPEKDSNREGCYRHAGPGRQDNHLHYFVGPDGMISLLAKLDQGRVIDPDGKSVCGVSDVANWTETFRRLYVPYYEEARQHFDAANGDGFFDGANEVSVFTQEKLQGVIAEYGGEDDKP